MRYTIEKGKHFFKPFQIKLWYKKTEFSYNTVFDNSCRNGVFLNNLFGVGYFPWCNIESARFGWLYDEVTQKIKLYAYCYVDSVKITEMIGSFGLNEELKLTLKVTKNEYIFSVYDINKTLGSVTNTVTIPHNNKRKLQYFLPPYFSGKAPQNIQIILL